MIRIIFKIFLTSIFLAGIFFVVRINYVLYSDGPSSGVNEVLLQLKFIGRKIDNRADAEMQNIYPEGYVFINALHGLSWCDVLEHLPHHSPEYIEGTKEIQKSFDRVNSDVGRSVFMDSLPIPHGAFYLGWNNYLLGRKIQLDKKQDSVEISQFLTQSQQIAEVIKTQIFPESYSCQSWPADAVVCVASLALHDKIFQPLYQDVLSDWIARVKRQLDSRGLIPHSAYTTGKAIQQARGSSQSLMLCFLNEIDSAFASEQFTLYKKFFLDSRFGLPGIREYPRGFSGLGDIDSGPVLLQIGGAASIVGVRALSIYHDDQAFVLREGIEAFGLPLKDAEEKKYVFGLLPMADAFITWAQCASLNSESVEIPWAFAFYSTLIILVILAVLLWIWYNDLFRHNKEKLSPLRVDW